VSCRRITQSPLDGWNTIDTLMLTISVPQSGLAGRTPHRAATEVLKLQSARGQLVAVTTERDSETDSEQPIPVAIPIGAIPSSTHPILTVGDREVIVNTMMIEVDSQLRRSVDARSNFESWCLYVDQYQGSLHVTYIGIGYAICRSIEKLWLVYGKLQKGTCSYLPSDPPRSGTQCMIFRLSLFG